MKKQTITREQADAVKLKVNKVWPGVAGRILDAIDSLVELENPKHSDGEPCNLPIPPDQNTGGASFVYTGEYGNPAGKWAVTNRNTIMFFDFGGKEADDLRWLLRAVPVRESLREGDRFYSSTFYGETGVWEVTHPLNAGIPKEETRYHVGNLDLGVFHSLHEVGWTIPVVLVRPVVMLPKTAECSDTHSSRYDLNWEKYMPVEQPEPVKPIKPYLLTKEK